MLFLGGATHNKTVQLTPPVLKSPVIKGMEYSKLNESSPVNQLSQLFDSDHSGDIRLVPIGMGFENNFFEEDLPVKGIDLYQEGNVDNDILKMTPDFKAPTIMRDISQREKENWNDP
jgi:hypothetical protein